MGPVLDPRSLLANDRVAHVSLRGQVQARRFVQGEWATVSHSVTELRRSPLGPRDRQLLYGTRFLVLERHGGFAFGQSACDGYVGYVDLRALGADQTPTHWLSVPASHLYTAPNIKAPEAMPLSLGARLTVVADIDDRFVQTAHGFFALRGHLSAIGQWAGDPVAVAMGFLGTPYLWGGNSRAGIDCSGLVQAALLACGISCPGDSD
ncbi:MAG: C40 family peptidase, partial [Paracoccaceae bacterium]|nr:C40 family peptidase [Paracoccaceae bacterium]